MKNTMKFLNLSKHFVNYYKRQHISCYTCCLRYNAPPLCSSDKRFFSTYKKEEKSNEHRTYLMGNSYVSMTALVWRHCKIFKSPLPKVSFVNSDKYVLRLSVQFFDHLSRVTAFYLYWMKFQEFLLKRHIKDGERVCIYMYSHHPSFFDILYRGGDLILDLISNGAHGS